MRYEISELGVGGILDQAIQLTKNHFGTLFGITLVLLVPFQLITVVAQWLLVPELLQIQQQPFGAPPQVNFDVASLIPIWILAAVQAMLVAPITNAAIVYAIATSYLGETISIGGAFKKAFSVVGPLILTWFLVFLAIMGGFILCIIPGIIAAFWFVLATQIVVLEDKSGIEAMKRSRFLMKGNIGTYFVVMLVVFLIQIPIGMIAGLLPGLLQGIVGALLQTIMLIFASAVLVVFYFSARCKHEHFDLALLAQGVGEEPPVISDPYAAP